MGLRTRDQRIWACPSCKKWLQVCYNPDCMKLPSDEKLISPKSSTQHIMKLSLCLRCNNINHKLLTYAYFLLGNVFLQLLPEENLAPILPHGSIVYQEEVGMIAVKDGWIGFGWRYTMIWDHNLKWEVEMLSSWCKISSLFCLNDIPWGKGCGLYIC